jgi:hypothetical protein
VHASAPEVRKAFRDAYRAFVEEYRNAVARLRAGERAEFPCGAFPPAGPFVAMRPAAT